MPSNIMQTNNWSCYRNLKVLKISHEGVFVTETFAFGFICKAHFTYGF